MPGPDILTTEIAEDILRHKVVALDFETNNSLTPRTGRITGLGVGCNNKSYYFEWRSGVKDLLIKIVNDYERICCWHSFQFDSKWLISENITWTCKMACTMVMWYLLDERRFGKYALKGEDGAAKIFYGLDLPEYKDAIQGDLFTNYTFSDYGRKDPEICKRLFDDKYLEIEEQGLKNVYWDFDCAVLAPTGQMEENGLYFNVEKLREMANADLEEMRSIEEESIKELGYRIDLSSPPQVSDTIFKNLELEPLDGMELGKNGKYSSDDDVLDLLSSKYPDCKFLKIARKHRGVAKNYSSYTGKYYELAKKGNGYVYGSFKTTRTLTGRYSGEFQQFPRVEDDEDPGIRRAICAPEGYLFIDADFSQIELRLVAHVAEEQIMIDAFNEDKDIHQIYADIWKCTRSISKNINFMLVYGGHWFKLWHMINKAMREKNLTEISQKEAKRLHGLYFETNKKIAAWQLSGREELHRTLCAKTLFGRRRRFSRNELLDEKMEEHCWRQFINSKIQGTAGDIVKRAIIRLDNKFKGMSIKDPLYKDVKLRLQVHDELGYTAPKSIAEESKSIVKYEMENAIRGLRVPLKVNVGMGDTWADAKT